MLFDKIRAPRPGLWRGILLIDTATPQLAVATHHGLIFGDNERDLVKKIKFVFEVGSVRFTSRRLFDSHNPQSRDLVVAEGRRRNSRHRYEP